jgi:hypothetical protein
VAQATASNAPRSVTSVTSTFFLTLTLSESPECTTHCERGGENKRQQPPHCQVRLRRPTDQLSKRDSAKSSSRPRGETIPVPRGRLAFSIRFAMLTASCPRFSRITLRSLLLVPPLVKTLAAAPTERNSVSETERVMEGRQFQQRRWKRRSACATFRGRPPSQQQGF